MSQLNVSVIKNVLGSGPGIDLFNGGNIAFDTNTLFIDSTNNRVGVGTSTPEAALHITGTGGFKLNTAPLVETVNIVAGTSNGNTTVNAIDGSIHYFTSANTGNFTPNIRGDASTTFDSLLAIGQVSTFTIISALGGSSGYCSSLQVDGTTRTLEWTDGSAPTERGGTSGVDAYQFTIIKTAADTFTILASKAYFN